MTGPCKWCCLFPRSEVCQSCYAVQVSMRERQCLLMRLLSVSACLAKLSLLVFNFSGLSIDGNANDRLSVMPLKAQKKLMKFICLHPWSECSCMNSGTIQCSVLMVVGTRCRPFKKYPFVLSTHTSFGMADVCQATWRFGLQRALCDFLLSSHKLEIETGRLDQAWNQAQIKAGFVICPASCVLLWHINIKRRTAKEK